MSTNANFRRLSGGQAVVECIRREGVRHVFNVPGESYLAALDAFFDAPEIQVITNRHEGGACFMAEAYGKVTRKPGVCFVTRGPGATHASVGVHCAAQDSTPLVLFVGQIPRMNRNREAFQEIDYERFFGSIAKWVVEIDYASKVPEVVTRAFHVARSGRPGPVVVVLPEDMLVDEADMFLSHPVPDTKPYPDPALVAEMVRRINAAERPILLVGSGVQYAGAREVLVQFSERFNLPVLTSWRRNDAFPNSHPNYAGNLALGKSPAQEAVKETDLLVVIGDRLSEITTADYTLPPPGTPMIQVDIDASVIGRTYSPDLALISDARLALEAAVGLEAAAPSAPRTEWVRSRRGAFEDFAGPKSRPAEHVDAERLMGDLREAMPDDAIITTDAGNFSAWVQRYYRFEGENTFLGPTVGSMGYGVPAAVAAKLAYPERTVIGSTGDGGFMMTGHEMATAVQYGVNLVQLVFNNRSLATIRMHQERDYPGRTIATDLQNPEFADMARSYGAFGYKVSSNDEFVPALKEALSARRPALLEIVTDLENLSVSTTLTDLRAGKGSPRRAPAN